MPNAKQPQGGIVKQEAGIHVSNVQLIDPAQNKPTRVGYKFVDGKKVRYAKKSGEEIGQSAAKKAAIKSG